MNPVATYYASWSVLIVLLVTLVAALVKLAHDLCRPSMMDQFEMERAARADAITRAAFIHRRKGFVSVAARLDDGRLINIKQFVDETAAKAFVEDKGIDGIRAMATQLAPPPRKRRPPRVSKKKQRLTEAAHARLQIEKQALF